MSKLAKTIISLSILLISAVVFSAVPQWWVERGVANEGDAAYTEENYSAANVGQLMFMASRAAAELNAKANGGAGQAINTLVSGFAPYNASNPDANYEVANIGQVKYVAKPFYDRLFEIEASYPGAVNFPAGMVFLSGGDRKSVV